MNKNKKEKYEADGLPDNPFDRAKREHDDIIGGAVVRAKNWRFFALFCLMLATISMLGNIYQSSKSSIQPYIIEVNELGAVQATGKADQKYKPTDAATKYFLGQFIAKIRSIPTDPVVMRNNYLSAYNFVTAKGRNTLNAIAAETDPFSQLGKIAVSIEIKSGVKMSDTSYQIQWEELEFNQNGSPAAKQQFIGVFNMVYQTPKNEKQIMANPLGIFIDFFNISQVQ